jgi:hypothetical protein
MRRGSEPPAVSRQRHIRQDEENHAGHYGLLAKCEIAPHQILE